MNKICILFLICYFAITYTSYSQTPKPPISPKWVYEPWVWEDTVQTKAAAQACINGYLDRDIPVAAVIIDSPWEWPLGPLPYVNNSSDQGYNTFIFDWKYYPMPGNFFNDLHNSGIRVILWISGNMVTNCPYYSYAQSRGYFINKSSTPGDTLVTSFWRGNRKASHIDFFNPAACAYWDSLMDRVLESDSIKIDGWKVDESESNISDGAVLYTFDGIKTKQQYKERYYAHLYNRTVQVKGQEVGMITARPYCKQKNKPGSFRAPIWANPAGWVGDQEHTWDGLNLALQNIFISSAAGYGSVGSDIGGFAKELDFDINKYINPNKNLFIRWAQFGALNPIMENGGQSNKQHFPWLFDSISDSTATRTYRYFAKLHHFLVPYLYSYNINAHLTGTSIIRPIGADTNAWKNNWRYFLGDNLFVAAIYTDDTVRTITFPDGKWIDFWNDDSVYNGGVTKSFNYGLTKYPIFIKSGSIIPLNVDASTTGHGSSASNNFLTLLVYPDSISTFTFYRAPSDTLNPLVLKCDHNYGGVIISSNNHIDSVIVCLKNDPEPDSVLISGGVKLQKKNTFTELETSASGWYFGSMSTGQNVYLWIKVSSAFDSIIVFNGCSLNLVPTNYSQSGLIAGNQYYVDRTYTLTNIPIKYSGLKMIKTANADKMKVGLDFHFDVCTNGDVYVAYDRRLTTIPNWISSNYTLTDDTISVSDNLTGHFKVWKRTVTPGRITFGDNQGVTNSSMYFVFYKEFNLADAKHLNVKALIEGFYNGVIMVEDTVSIRLHNAASPYGFFEEAKTILNQTGNAFADFFYAKNAINYFIVCKHRNSIETWSKNPQQFVSGALAYDFTTSANKAYGDNLKLKNSKYCFFSGDVNQDGLIDLSDVSLTDIDNLSFISGYVLTDVNGDGIVDLSDVAIVDINNLNFVAKITS